MLLCLMKANMSRRPFRLYPLMLVRNNTSVEFLFYYSAIFFYFSLLHGVYKNICHMIFYCPLLKMEPLAHICCCTVRLHTAAAIGIYCVT